MNSLSISSASLDYVYQFVTIFASRMLIITIPDEENDIYIPVFVSLFIRIQPDLSQKR